MNASIIGTEVHVDGVVMGTVDLSAATGMLTARVTDADGGLHVLHAPTARQLLERLRFDTLPVDHLDRGPFRRSDPHAPWAAS